MPGVSISSLAGVAAILVCIVNQAIAALFPDGVAETILELLPTEGKLEAIVAPFRGWFDY